MVEDGRDGREERDADFASFDAVGDGVDLDDGVVVALNAADALERQLQEEEIRRCVRVWNFSQVLTAWGRIGGSGGKAADSGHKRYEFASLSFDGFKGHI